MLAFLFSIKCAFEKTGKRDIVLMLLLSSLYNMYSIRDKQKLNVYYSAPKWITVSGEYGAFKNTSANQDLWLFNIGV